MPSAFPEQWNTSALPRRRGPRCHRVAGSFRASRTTRRSRDKAGTAPRFRTLKEPIVRTSPWFRRSSSTVSLATRHHNSQERSVVWVKIRWDGDLQAALMAMERGLPARR